MQRIKRLLPILASGLLIGYVLLLLGLTHFEQQARMASAVEQTRLGLEKRAAALSYFYNVRRDDLRTLEEHRSVTTFFANRDLGMSMQYGLGASLLKMRQAFEQLYTERRISGEPVYNRLQLLQPDGKSLLDTHPHLTSHFSQLSSLKPDTIEILAQGATSRGKILVASPLYYKDKLEGYILAWINQELVQEQLISTDRDNPHGQILLHLTNTPVPATFPLPAFDSQLRATEGFGAWHMPDGGISGRVKVEETPFELIGSFPAQGISRILSTSWFTSSLLLLTTMILLGAWIAVRIHTDNEVLRVRIEESERQERILNNKNQELEQEIARRKEYEKKLVQARQDAEAASRAKSEFLATMSHEIRTPINGALGMVELIMHSGLKEKQRHYAETAYQSGKMLLEVVDSILDYSKIETNEITLARSSFNLEEIIEDTLQKATVKAHDKALELHRDIPAELPLELIGDGPRLRQVLSNLLSNAVKFTEQGEITLRLIPVEEGKGAIKIRFEVTDSGIGIDTEKLSDIFEAFKQADGTTSRKFGGTGLGLAISRHLVALMGGEIGVESQKGTGSTFHFTLAFTKQRADGKKGLPSPTSSQDSHRILLVEDNPVNQELTLSLLEILGYDAELVENGKEAVAYIQAHDCDLILMDCHMPVMDGFTAARAIRDHENNETLVPIVALTADVQEGIKQKCLYAGMTDYLSKPFNQDELGLMLEKWLTAG